MGVWRWVTCTLFLDPKDHLDSNISGKDGPKEQPIKLKHFSLLNAASVQERPTSELNLCYSA